MNEKKKKKMQNLKWATAHLSIRLGAGAQAGCAAAGRLALGGRWALGAWGQLGSGRWGLLGARRGTGAGHATMGAQAGLSWVHCAPASVLTQFLDSVLFPSHFLDTVHEPGS